MTKKRAKKLIFLTNIFPYEKGEAFIEAEFPFLEGYFDEIHIVTTHPKTDNCRIDTSKTRVSSFLYRFEAMDVVRLIGILFSRVLWREIRDIRKNYRLTFSKTLINTLFKSLLFAKKMADFIVEQDKMNPDSQTLLYSYWCNNTALASVMAKKKIPHAVAISKTHGWDLFFERADSAYLPYRRFLLNHLDKLVFISKEGHDYFSNKFPYCPTDKLHISRLGVNRVDSLNPEHSDTFRIVSCSNIIPLKQIDKIIEALSLVNTPIEWVHFGAGTPAYENKIKLLCKQKLDSKENIQYQLRGFVENKEVLNYYTDNHISLFINTSKTEGLPVSIMEAMAAGIPVIAPAVNGIPEIVNESNGLLLSADFKAEELAKAIRKFVKMDMHEMGTYRRNALRTWEKGYDAELNFKLFIDFIESLLF